MSKIRIHRHNSTTLACIREHLGARNHMHAIVGIATYCWLIRWFVWRTAFCITEVHIHICQIFNHKHIVACSQLSYNLQFALCHAHPRRIIRIRKQHRSYPTRLESSFQFHCQCFTPIICHIHRFNTHANHFTLLLLHRKAWI